MDNIQSIMKKFDAKWLIFTDLDGTLLDRQYDLQAAGKAMDSLHEYGCICIPASSKTDAEMQELNRFRKFPSPYIFENGAGLRWPSAPACELIGRPVDEIYSLLNHINEEHGFQYQVMSDIPCEEIQAMTGLNEAGVSAAVARAASVPLLWKDSEQAFDSFSAILGFIGLQIVKGGLFYSVLDKSCSKASAMQRLVERFTNVRQQPVLVACGDAENDRGMLALADIAILFPNKNRGYLSIRHPALHHAAASGHESWLKTLGRVLSLNEPPVKETMAKTESIPFE